MVNQKMTWDWSKEGLEASIARMRENVATLDVRIREQIAGQGAGWKSKVRTLRTSRAILRTNLKNAVSRLQAL